MTQADAPRRNWARVNEPVAARVRTLTPADAARLSRRLLALAAEGAEPEPAGPPPLGAGEASWERLALATLLARMERLEQAVSALARPTDDTGGGDGGDDAWMSGETRTLSGGGAGIVLPRSLEPGAPLELELPLPDDPPPVIRAIGRVTTCVPEPDGTRWLVGLAFTAIPPADRETLVRFTFRVQRARLRERRQGNDL